MSSVEKLRENNVCNPDGWRQKSITYGVQPAICNIRQLQGILTLGAQPQGYTHSARDRVLVNVLNLLVMALQENRIIIDDKMAKLQPFK